METTEITVRIEHNVKGGSTGSPVGTDKQPKLDGAGADIQSSGGGATKAIGAMALKKGLQYGASNYGNLTGDYLAQSQINSTIEIAGLIGMAATGPIGIAVAVTSIGFKAIDFYTNRAKENQNIEYLRQRTATWNGSR